MATPQRRFMVDIGWQLLLHNLGINAQDLLRSADLPLDLFVRPEPSLSTDEYFRIWHAIGELMNDPAFPLRVGTSISVEVFNPALFASFCSPDLNTALVRLEKYKPLIGPLTKSVLRSESKTEVELTIQGIPGHGPVSMLLTELVFLTQLVRMATRQNVVPLRLELPELPDDTAPFEAYFGCKMVESGRTYVAFSAKDASLPFLSVNDAMFQVFDAELSKRLHELNTLSPFWQRVRACLMGMIASGRVSLEEAAGQLAISPRTLQRRLREEGFSFQEVLSDLRRELATHYLTNTAYSASEISFLLGYDDPNSFYRAFQGWTGTTPAQVRRVGLFPHPVSG